jgi:hypothetical protein
MMPRRVAEVVHHGRDYAGPYTRVRYDDGTTEDLHRCYIHERQFDSAVDCLHAVRAFAEARIAEIEADERHHYPRANVQVNAPLALEQVRMSATQEAFRKILALCPED